ncbi:MAG TPA: thiamine phosphate synthase [Smithellaceae bacterium]|nr:thiamine phosphate synthase [Smithellaceae bacterium]HRS89367.1 thiamine phosphate synthase [Smithellaceae bacterium]HRV26572.1 thiamine phosphate synthase [Smithellaceae bacterium]
MRGLYLVTDRELCRGRPLTQIVRQAVEGGVAYVQLREKGLSFRDFVDEALEIKKLLETCRVPLIINDRVDVALACGAAGVHLGQSDMPYSEARKIMGAKTIIGLSVETWPDVEEAERFDVNYIAVSPVFTTPTKTDTKEPWGLEGLKKIKKFSRHTLVAIGGVNEKNISAVVTAGADCVAVVSAICAADDPFLATRSLKDLIDSAVFP